MMPIEIITDFAETLKNIERTETMDTTEILSILITVIIIPLATWAITALTDFLKTKTENAKLDKLLDVAQDAITTAVQEVMQTYVSSLKKSGEWNDETKIIALEMAKQKAIDLMGVAAYKALGTLFDSAERQMQEWMTAKIEAATRAEKLKEGC